MGLPEASCYTVDMLLRPFTTPTVLVLVFVFRLSAHVLAHPPPGYYDSVDATNAATLRATLHEIIDDHLRFPYTAPSTDTWDILNLADQDLNNSGNILDMYKNVSYPRISGGVVFSSRLANLPRSSYNDVRQISV